MAAGGKRRHGGLGLAAFRRKSGVQAKPEPGKGAEGELPKGMSACPVCRFECGDWNGCVAHLLEFRSPGFVIGDDVRCVADSRKRGRVIQVDSDHRLMTVRMEFADGTREDRRVLIWVLDLPNDRAHYFWVRDDEVAKMAAAG